jgi:hypothetical protein
MSDTVTRRLQVVGCEVRYQGSNDKGPYTIYEIAALDQNGEPVEQDLRSFDELPVDGELHEFEVTPYNHPKHGRSYTLKLPGQGGSKSPSPARGSGRRSTRCARRSSAQQQQIGELNRRLAELEGRLKAAPTGGLMSRTTPTPDEEDIPF